MKKIPTFTVALVCTFVALALLAAPAAPAAPVAARACPTLTSTRTLGPGYVPENTVRCARNGAPNFRSPEHWSSMSA